MSIEINDEAEMRKSLEQAYEFIEHLQRQVKWQAEKIEKLQTAKLQIKEILQKEEMHFLHLQIIKIEETFDGLRIYVK